MRGQWERRTSESYDEVARAYADMTRSAPAENLHMASDYARLADLALCASGAEPATVVDVGCGPGWWVKYLADRGVRAAGIDVSPRMIDLARSATPHAHFEVGSILDLPLPSQYATAVCCMYVLHHLPDEDVDAALAELFRILAPGGVLLLGGHVGHEATTKMQGYGGHPMHVHINKRSTEFWEHAVERVALTIEAHVIYGPGQLESSHALFARRDASCAH